MEKVYFTFGSSEKFPYQNTYIIIVARDLRDAIKEFRKRFPDRNPDEPCLNCSFYYSESEWQKDCIEYYKDVEPADVFFTDNCYGVKAPGFDDIYIYVPNKGDISRIALADRANFRDKDKAEGLKDCILIDSYRLDSLHDVGMYGIGLNAQILCTGMKVLKFDYYLNEKYTCLADCIPLVTEKCYGDKFTKCILLNKDII